MSVAHVATTSALNSSTISFSCGAGRCLVVVITYPYAGAAPTLSLSDGTHTYTRAVQAWQSFGNTEMFTAKNSVSGSYTLTISGISGGTIIVSEYSGASTTSPVKGTASGFRTSGSSQDVVTTSVSAAGASGDAIVVAASNYYGPQSWTVGATNPSGIAIPTNGVRNGTDGTPNGALAYAVLSGAYSGAASLNPGANNYSSAVAIVIAAAGGGATTYNDSIALGVGSHVDDSVQASIAASLALGAAGGTSDGAAATVAATGALGLQAGTSGSVQAAIAAAVAAGVTQAFAATNGSLYSSSIGLGAAAATSAGATLGLSLSAALAAQYGVSASPRATARATAALGAALATNPQAVLTVSAQIGTGIGAGVATRGGLVFADSIALGAFARAVAAQVAGVVSVIGRAVLFDAPAFRAVVSDGLAGNAIVSDSPVGGAAIDEL